MAKKVYLHAKVWIFQNETSVKKKKERWVGRAIDISKGSKLHVFYRQINATI